METTYTKMSSRGQVVIPQSLREGMDEGTPFAVSRKNNVIILRAMEVPDMEGEWQRLFAMGEKYAKEKGIKPEDVDRAIEKLRR